MLERGKPRRPDAPSPRTRPTSSPTCTPTARLTLSKDFRFQVAQGMCVGGSTVVNNAVCFDLPEHVRDRWNGASRGGAATTAGCGRRSTTSASSCTSPRSGPADVRNPGARAHRRRRQGSRRRTARRHVRVVDCNIADCLGSGYCNIGCKYGNKLSALDYTLPRGAAPLPGSGARPARVPRRQGARCEEQGRGRAARSSATGAGSRCARDTVVLSAGAIASSSILQRSGLGEGRAGRSLAFNMASPVTLDFERGAALRARHPDLALLRAASAATTQASRSRPGSTRSSRSRCSCPAGSSEHRDEHAPLQAHDLPGRGRRDGVERHA